MLFKPNEPRCRGRAGCGQGLRLAREMLSRAITLLILGGSAYIA